VTKYELVIDISRLRVWTTVWSQGMACRNEHVRSTAKFHFRLQQSLSWCFLACMNARTNISKRSWYLVCYALHVFVTFSI